MIWWLSIIEVVSVNPVEFIPRVKSDANKLRCWVTILFVIGKVGLVGYHRGGGGYVKLICIIPVEFI